MPARLSVAALTVAALTASVAAKAAAPDLVLRDTTYRVAPDHGSDSLVVREFLFGATVQAAVVDSASGMLLVSIAIRGEEPSSDDPSLFRDRGWGARLFAYDLRERRIIWEERTRAIPWAAARRRALLGMNEKQADLIRLPDGRRLGEVSGEIFAWRDGAAVRVTEDGVHGYDFDVAHDLWSVGRGVHGPVDGVLRRDSVAYLVAEGLQKLDLREGSLWSFSMRGNRSGIYHLPGGSGVIQMRTMFGGNRAVRMAAWPLVLEPDIFFAADTTVVRLDAHTGIARWRQHLRRMRGFSLRQRALGLPPTQEFLGRLLLRDAGDNLAVASLGWAGGKDNVWVADPPTFGLLSKQDGRLLARVQVPGIQYLYDARSTPRGHYLLAADRVIAMDDSLRVRATYRPEPGQQPLTEFIQVGDAVVVATASGLTALSPESLKVVWAQPCGRVLAVEEWPGLGGTRYLATTQGLQCLDWTAGHRMTASYPMRGAWAIFRERGLLLGVGARLRLVTLPRPVVNMEEEAGPGSSRSGS